MATTPAFIATPRIGVGTLTTGQTDRSSGTASAVVDVISAGTNGTRVLELVVKADNDPADSCVVFWLNNGSTNFVFDEIDMGNPASASATVPSYRGSLTYSNLVLPSGWKLQASVTATPTAGSIIVHAFGGDL